MSQDVSGTERGFLEQMSLSRLSLWGTLRAVGRGLREAVAPARQPPAPRQLLQAMLDWREQSREQKARGVWGARPTARTEPQPVRGQGGTNCKRLWPDLDLAGGEEFSAGVWARLGAPWAEGTEGVEEPSGQRGPHRSAALTGGEEGAQAHPPGAPCVHPRLQGAKIEGHRLMALGTTEVRPRASGLRRVSERAPSSRALRS